MGKFQIQNNLTGTPVMVRVVIFHDKNNTINTVSEYFDSLELGTGQAPLSYKNQANLYNSQLIYDKNSILVPATETQWRVIDLNKQLNIFTNYDQASAQIRTGSIKMILISSVSPGVGSRPAVNLNLKLTYTDA